MQRIECSSPFERLFRTRKADFILLEISRMKLPLLLGAVALTSVAQGAQAKVVTRNVDYRDGATTLQGYVAYDDAIKGKRPGVLIAHQWMGLSEYEKRRARMLAQLGYVAFALDIYGKGIRPKNREEPRRSRSAGRNIAPTGLCCANVLAPPFSNCVKIRW